MAGDDEDTLLDSMLGAETKGVEKEAPAEKEEVKDDAIETEEKDESEAGSEEPADDIDDGGEEAAPEKPVGRAQARIQKLSSELKAEREDREKLIVERATAQAQLEHLRQQQYAAQSAAQQKDEEDRLSLLDPTERAIYQANARAGQLEYKLNLMQMQMQDNADRANFAAKATHDPTYGKYLDQVENMYQEGLKRGVTAPREELHSLILGRELKKDMANKLSAKKESASKRIDTVTSKPASARGDVAGSKKGKSEEERLRGVLI
jgi:hypothetical protein